MFGQFVYARDQELIETQDRRSAQLAYARVLLAELLNRAAMLEEGAYWLAFTKHLETESGTADPEYGQALENLAGAVRLFLDDCSEARIRARRARLVCVDLMGEALVGCESVESDAALASIGGPLIRDPAA